MNNTGVVLIIVLSMCMPPVFAEMQNQHPLSVLPFHFDWRDINGTDFTTPIKNQAPAPTCEAYALVAALETLVQYETQTIFEPDLSETHLYFYAGGTYESGYVNLVDAANYLVEYGVPDEGCYPDPHRPFDYHFESLSGWENRTVKIQEWGWVHHDEESIKRALIDFGPLILCAYFWSDFYYYRGGVYQHRWGPRAGGHVMAIVGYDDTERCWIVKNSWGTSWGENGWLRISYDADMIAEWYGEGTGIMYIHGVYGNLMPDVPKIQIQQPQIFHTYFFGFDLPTIFRKIPLLQEAAPRIICTITVEIHSENTNKVEFYLDENLIYVDEEQPYEWALEASMGVHTLKTLAYNAVGNISQDIRDIAIIFN